MTTAPTPLIVDPSGHDPRPAVVLPDGTTITRHELAGLVAMRARSWGPGRRLVLVEGGNRLDALVAHLAALDHGHVSLLVPAGRPEQRDALVAQFDPDVVCSVEGDDVRRPRSAHVLHPDLALLLSTSGSTGSPKLVRLSRTNVYSNAAAIADFLGLGPHSRAITSLPLHYCYGLSVVHSHLVAGGSLAVTERSVTDAEFWDHLERSGATTMAAVPYTFDLLERVDLATRPTASLTQITVAGGRLAPDRVRAWSLRGRDEGWDLVVMYGQTEATARMAWLPPSLAAEHPYAIGHAIPGGHLRLEPVPESDEPGTGEIVYSGPNVMMGYASRPADLALAATTADLRTGDLGRMREGLFEVVGRRNRFAKVFGLRLDLARVESLLSENGSPAELVATATHVHAFVLHGRRAEVTRTRVADFCGLPTAAVRTHVVAELPRTPNGKVDRAALARLAELAESEPALDAGPGEDRVAWVVDTVAHVLGRAEVTGADSFVQLGGDSLSFVETSARLEEHLGPLPPQWPSLPLRDLAARRTGHDTVGASAGSQLDTTVAIRAAAILAVVASHVDLVSWEGGAHLLLALSGYNFARFQLGSPERHVRIRNGLSSLAQLVVPSVVVLALIALATGQYEPTTVLLLNGLLGQDSWDDQWQMWFIESLAWLTAAALALMAVPSLHRLERRHPYAFALALLSAAAALRWAWTGQEAGATERYTTGVVAFCFALGWVTARSDTALRRWLTLCATAALLVGFFDDPAREAVVVGGVAALLWWPALPTPRRVSSWVVRPAHLLAASSLAIYLTHWVVYRPLEDAGHRWLALVAALAVGICASGALRPLQRAVASCFGPSRTRPIARPTRQDAAV
ncbi:MAG: AMP-binding protein [Nocardioides sp.]|uniref:AMP-binding protein n=1 Tax=Nocardioides sp. TaxID=35761 RepID=UPI003F041A36